MLLRFTNLLLLILVLALTLTGLAGLVWANLAWVFDLHRVTAWALIALVPWKTIISARSLRRGPQSSFGRGLLISASVLLATATVFVIGLALLWTWRLGPSAIWPGFSLINLHWVVGLALLPLFGLHFWKRWPRPKRMDFASRRGMLRLLGVSVVGVLGWQAAEALANARTPPLNSRRASGSRERGSFQGNAFPVTTNPGDGLLLLTPKDWKLRLEGRVRRPFELSYAELLSLPSTQAVATLDCTVGWYSTQIWQGIPLEELLAFAEPQVVVGYVRLQAASGYSKGFLLPHAREILLATHVGSEPLSHEHGFPLRAVIPSRRGWFWVKWLTAITVVGWSPSKAGA